MSDFPTLNRMGISNPQDIDRYSVQTASNVDILRVVFKTAKGSFLPVSKRFRFDRTEKVILAEDGDPRDTRIFTEVSPYLRDAMLELDKVVRTKRSAKKQVELIREEIERLKDEMAGRMDYIQSLLDELSSRKAG